MRTACSRKHLRLVIYHCYH